MKDSNELFSLKIYKPHLDKPVEVEIVSCLGEIGFSNQDMDTLWTKISRVYRATELKYCIESDPDFQDGQYLLFEKMYCTNANIDDDDLWCDLYYSNDFIELENRFYEKYSINKDEIEWRCL